MPARPATPAAPGNAAAPMPLAVYVHVPWCVRKCPYCDFNSHHLRGVLPADAYVDALLADLDQDLTEQPPGTNSAAVSSIFIGGGTPSLLPAAAIERLLAGVAARLPVTPDLEITLEANPGTVERHAFAAFRAAGVNRLSLGIQSFDDTRLHLLGRVHDGAQALSAAEEAVAHFDRVNLDIMFALPGQSLDACLRDLQRALQFAPGHLSHYELTLEPGTVFARYPPDALPDHDLASDMRDASEALLANAGYHAYETSAYAASTAARARHNLNYWTFGDYIGIGAGAHGKRSRGGCVRRTAKLRSPQAYLGAAGTPGRIAMDTVVSGGELTGEFMLNALRLTDGFQESLLTHRLGPDAAQQARPALAEAVRDGFLDRVQGGWRPTALGRRFLNDLQGRFLP
jgi:putative oxygen-independent coproporphyrinogen III oxidase